MRGVVTLAAVFLLPAKTPERALLALAAFTVVAGTLLHPGPHPAVARAAAEPARPGRRRGRAAGRRAGHHRGPGRASPCWTRCRPTTTRPRCSTSCANGPTGAATRSGSSSAARSPSSSRRPRPTGGCGCRCSRPSAARSSRRATAASTTTRCCAPRCTAIDLEESLLDRIEDAAARIDDELTTPDEARRRLRAPARRAPGRQGPHARGLRGVPARRHPLGASAAVPHLRARRLLRLVHRRSTPPGTSTRPGTRSCARSSRARPGAGATWTTCSADRCVRSRGARAAGTATTVGLRDRALVQVPVLGPT